jgi:hypothetical protein
VYIETGWALRNLVSVFTREDDAKGNSNKLLPGKYPPKYKKTAIILEWKEGK